MALRGAVSRRSLLGVTQRETYAVVGFYLLEHRDVRFGYSLVAHRGTEHRICAAELHTTHSVLDSVTPPF